MMVSWEARARFYDLCEGSDLRRGWHKHVLFRRIRGRTLFVGIGTGLDIKHLPIGADVIAIDNSRAMIDKSRRRAGRFAGKLYLVQGDAGKLSFGDLAFDTVVTSCTMCSVPEPVKVFRELFRVLKPEGQLLMFEHVRSKNPILGPILDLMTMVSGGRGGTQMNRDTLAGATNGGFRILEVEPIFLDIILAVVAAKVTCGTTLTQMRSAQPGLPDSGGNDATPPRTPLASADHDGGFTSLARAHNVTQ